MGHSFGTTIAASHIAKHQRQWAGLVLSAPISDSVFSGPMLAGASAVELYYRLSQALPERAAHALLRSDAILELRSEEHTSELQSRGHLVCRLLLEKKKIN